MDAIYDQEPLPPRRGLGLLLFDHHRRLEHMCRELLSHADDCRDLVAAWAAFEAELVDHMAAEEEILLPSYAKHAPADAKRILDDHARIRELLPVLGVDIELHEVRIARLRRLVDALASHSRYEDEIMYPWAQRHLTEVVQQALIARVGRWFAT